MSLGQHAGDTRARDTRAGALARNGLAAVLALGAVPALAGEPAPSADSQARDLAAEVLERTGGDGAAGLGAWTRSVIDRALERAGTAASETAGASRTGEPAGRSPAPLPAELHATRVAEGAGRPDTGEVLVFLSLSVPPASWTQWAREAARRGAPLMLRGVGPDGFRTTVTDIGRRLGGFEAGVAIDPRLFRLFGVERVPAVVVVPGGVGPCASRGCADDAPPPFDLVTGNIGLAAALEAVAAEGDAGRDIARAHLERLSGENR